MNKYLVSTPVLRSMTFDHFGNPRTASVGFQGLKWVVHLRMNLNEDVVSIKGPQMPGGMFSKNAARKAELLRLRAVSFLQEMGYVREPDPEAVEETRDQVKELAL